MKLEQQVCSLDLAKRLKELGVKQSSYFWWRVPNEKHREENAGVLLIDKTGVINDSNWFDYFSAFTVAELGEMLKTYKGKQGGEFISSNFDNDEDFVWICQIQYWGNERRIGHTESATTEADARAKMLIYLLENKLI